MSRPDHSSLSSPVRKRQRLSSPTYDEQLGDLSQEDIDAFDAIEAKLSQSQFSQSPRKSPQGSPGVKAKRVRAIAEALSQGVRADEPAATHLADDSDNPFSAEFKPAQMALPMFSKASAFTSALQASPSALQSPHNYERSPSPEAPPELDIDSWFEPVPVPAVAFQTAKFASAVALPTVGSQATPVGFMKASNKGWLAPSAAALAKAQEIMKDILADDTNTSHSDMAPSNTHLNDSENAFKIASTPSNISPQRPALRALENSNTPGTPIPSGFSRPSASVSITSVASPLNQMGAKGRQKPFASPFLKPPPSKSHVISSNITGPGLIGSPLNPTSRLPGLSSFTPVRSQVSSNPTATSFSTPSRPVAGPSSFTTPIRPFGVTPKRAGDGTRSTPIPFVTPFKAGMKPGQPGRLRLEEIAKDKEKQAALTKPAKAGETWLTKERPMDKGKQVDRSKSFNFKKPLNRQTLVSSGLMPQKYTVDELELMGINASELTQMSPNLATYYSFHTASTTPPSSTEASLSPSSPKLLGPPAALEELLERGCTLATKPWVDNHWCLILWKLAGMVSLDPERENDPKQKRWCWAEVMRQLFYRYERELNGGSRPPFRLISTQDAPASYPMVLCVSNITWSEGGPADDGTPTEPHPELEVTDGWYRLRAQVDAPLARAIRRGIIRVGRKIGVAGARLSSERKDPMEILEAYNSTKLVLAGNSSHLMPWHAKLGFQVGPCVSTLHSLTGDGGCVAVMDTVVLKSYPVAFIEFIEDENGQKHREGPRSEPEELSVNEKWKRRRDVEASKIRLELDKKMNRYEGYIDRLERHAGDRFRPAEYDAPPDDIENLYDELEDPTDASRVLARLHPNEAGWLARHIRDRIEKDRERAGDEIEQELKGICPPREVRSFRVLVVQDARTCRRPANRTAQLTVWDVQNLLLSEGSPAGSFETGQRYLVTNLVPTQQNAWMGCEPGSEVYLSTRRDSRWTRMRS